MTPACPAEFHVRSYTRDHPTLIPARLPGGSKAAMLGNGQQRREMAGVQHMLDNLTIYVRTMRFLFDSQTDKVVHTTVETS